MPEGNGTDAAVAEAVSATDHTGASRDGGNDQGTAANNQGRGWLAGLPADLRDKPEFQSMQKPGDLAKAYLDANAKLAKAIIPPGDNARDDEVKAFRSKLGVPENPEAYEIDSPGDEEFVNTFRKVAHEQGLTPAQAKKVFAEIQAASRSYVERSKAEAESRRKQATETLRSEWGDRYDLNDAAARRVALVSGGDFSQALAETGALDDPRVLKGLYRFANMISEDRLVEGRGQRATDTGWQFPNTPGM